MLLLPMTLRRAASRLRVQGFNERFSLRNEDSTLLRFNQAVIAGKEKAAKQIGKPRRLHLTSFHV
jgi:hypothetical protein